MTESGTCGNGTDRQRHTEYEIGETITKHPRKDGPVVSYFTDVVPGARTNSVTVDAEDLRRAVFSSLRDSYPSVYFWSDGDTLAVTDHRHPTDEAQVGELSEADESTEVKRVEAIRTPESATVALVDRDNISDAFLKLDGDRVTVHVDDDRPVFIEGENVTVGISPLLNESIARAGGGR